MHAGLWLLLIVVAGLACAISWLAVRVSRLRGSGTAVLIRYLPAQDGQGWRHGIFIYRETTIRYYRLMSIRPGPSAEFGRSLSIADRRERYSGESDLIDSDQSVVRVVENKPGRDVREFELALDADSLTAFSSWVESRPSERSQRRKSA